MNMKLNNRDFTHIEMLLALAILSLIVAIGMSVYDGSYSFFSSIRRHTRSLCDWSSDVCSSDLAETLDATVRIQVFGRPTEAILEALRQQEIGRARVGKSVDLGGRRIIKKKKREELQGRSATFNHQSEHNGRRRFGKTDT